MEYIKQLLQKLVPLIGTLVIAGCATWIGKPQSETAEKGDENKGVLPDLPDDSTGKMGSVQLNLIGSKDQGFGDHSLLTENKSKSISFSLQQNEFEDDLPQEIIDCEKKFDTEFLSDTPSNDVFFCPSEVRLKKALINVGGFRIKAKDELSKSEKELAELVKLERDKQLAVYADEIEANNAEENRIWDEIDALLEAADTQQERDDIFEKELSEENQEILEKNWNIYRKIDSHLQEFERQRDKNVAWGESTIYDLMSFKRAPLPVSIELNDGSYSRLDFYMHPSNSEAAEHSLLRNKALIMEGTYFYQNEETKFEIKFESFEKFRLTGSRQLFVAPDKTTGIDIELDVSSWLMEFDPRQIAPSDKTGILEINSKSHREIYDSIGRSIRENTRYGVDKNNDGFLDDQESFGDGFNSYETIDTDGWGYEELPSDSEY